MPQKYTYNASLKGNMNVAVDCEACSRYYSYTQALEVKSSQTVNSPQPSAEQENKAKVAEKYANIVKQRHLTKNYGFKACPQCGYTQSWMLKSVRQELVSKIGVMIGVTLVVLLAIFECRLALGAMGDGGLSTGSFIFAVLGVIFIIASTIMVVSHIVHRFYDPNRNQTIPDTVNEPNIVFDPSPADMSIAMGLQFLQGQQTGQALSAFQKAIDADAGSAKAYMGRSLAYEASGEIEAASKDLRRYLAISGSKADPQMVKHLDELQFKHFSAIPSTNDPNEKSPPKRVGIEVLLRFLAIAVVATIILFALTQVLEFDRLIVSILVAVAGGGLLAAAIDTFLAQQAKVNLSVPSPMVSLGMIPFLLLTGMKLDTETVNWDRFSGITSEVKAICESPSGRFNQSTVSSFGKVWVHGDPNAGDFDFDEAANLDDIDILICVDESKDQLQRCSYTNGGSVTRYQRKWSVTVIDFESRTIVASNTFSGDTPGTCPGSISSSGNSDKNGSEPSRTEVSNWLHSLERG